MGYPVLRFPRCPTLPAKTPSAGDKSVTRILFPFWLVDAVVVTSWSAPTNLSIPPPAAGPGKLCYGSDPILRWVERLPQFLPPSRHSSLKPFRSFSLLFTPSVLVSKNVKVFFYTQFLPPFDLFTFIWFSVVPIQSQRPRLFFSVRLIRFLYCLIPPLFSSALYSPCRSRRPGPFA